MVIFFRLFKEGRILICLIGSDSLSGFHKKRIENFPKNDSILGSSNFSTLIKYLEDENCKWIDKINYELEQDRKSVV